MVCLLSLAKERMCLKENMYKTGLFVRKDSFMGSSIVWWWVGVFRKVPHGKIKHGRLWCDVGAISLSQERMYLSIYKSRLII